MITKKQSIAPPKSLLELDFRNVNISREGNIWTLKIQGDHESLSVAALSGMKEILNGHDVRLGTYDVTSSWTDDDPLRAILTAATYIASMMKILIDERDGT